MKLYQLVEQYVHPSIEGQTITAYHCGNNFDGNFDLKYSGTGEGLRVLGPGMYFHTNKGQALSYAKYAKMEPTLFTCEIRIDHFYDVGGAIPDAMQTTLNAIATEMGFTNWQALPRNYDTFKNGFGVVGQIVKQLGHAAAQNMLLKHGVNGCIQYINPAWEISVYNTKCIQIMDREPINLPP